MDQYKQQCAHWYGVLVIQWLLSQLYQYQNTECGYVEIRNWSILTYIMVNHY